NYGRLSVSYGGKFLLGCFLCYFLFDRILVKIIKLNLNLRENCIERRIYENIPFSLSFKVYIFHVLNKDEVHNGAKPHFKEIGPYIFDEYVWKQNISDNVEEDTMTFTTMKKYVFRPDLSNGLTGEEIVTIIHPVIASIGLTVHFEYRQFLHVAVQAIHEIFHEPTDVFWTGRAMNLLFDGIEIDCGVTNPLSKLACGEMRRSAHPSIQKITKERLKFSFMGGYNNTSHGVWKVNRGVRDVRFVGHVLEVDGITEMDVWNGDECNKLNGTDGLLFTPLQSKKEPVSIFASQICASLHLRYARRASFRGVDLGTFVNNFEINSTNSLSCFCRKPDRCPARGTMDLMPCVKAPVTISQPHFYNADPSLLANIASGLKPVREKHEFYLSLEMYSGVPLRGAGRVQVNFEVEPVKEIEIMANLPKMIFPCVWFEESADLPDYLVNLLKYTLTFGLTAHCALQWITMTYWLLATIGCTTIFLLTRYTDINVLEKDALFTRSPQISKIGPIVTMVSEQPLKDFNGVEANEKDQHDKNCLPKTDAVLLVNEIVTRATSAANKGHLQNDFDQPKP
ncbi:sensory neuron membrane protein 1-like, partial [Contarinia nasturtii]|uniref:sensory neuron membrane protein 1-like n=1 Tax=Contarinia nasturtii TaxID=265458 RepID=UPI0012D3B7EC